MLLKHRPQAELSILRALEELHTEHAKRVASALTAGRTVSDADWLAIERELRDALPNFLADVHARAAAQMVHALAVSAPNANAPEPGKSLREQSREWAEEHAATLARGLVATSREQLAGAVAKLGPDATVDELQAIARGVFSSARAEAIASTETTRAITSGERGIVNRFNTVNPDEALVPFWNTADDDKTCWICAPLDNQPEEVFGVEFAEGPPAHPNCRCWLDWKPAGSRTGHRGDVFFTRLEPVA